MDALLGQMTLEENVVRLVVHYDQKGDTTIFDAEVAGERTLLCIRRGKWCVVPGAR